MTKKTVVLCALINVAYAHGYPAEQGHQVSQESHQESHHDRHHHHHGHHHDKTYSPEDQRAIERGEKEIDELKELIKDPYQKSTVCWWTTGFGALGFVFSLSTQNTTGMVVSGGTAAIAGTMGKYIRGSESEKIKECTAKINVIEDRLEKIRASYRRR